MDKDRVIGSAKVLKGTVKEAVGKASGEARLEAEGKADKAEGKVENNVGGMKDHCAVSVCQVRIAASPHQFSDPWTVSPWSGLTPRAGRGEAQSR